MTHLFFGSILVALGVWGIVAWWGLFGLVMRGVVPFFLLVFGLVAIIAGCRRSAHAEAKACGVEVFPQEPAATGAEASAKPN